MKTSNTFTTFRPSLSGNWKDGKTHIIAKKIQAPDPVNNKLRALCGLEKSPLMVAMGKKQCDCKKCLNKAKA